MNKLLWVLQILTALLYGSSGVMNVFMFEKVSHGLAFFGAMPRQGWAALGIFELTCAVGLAAPAAFHWRPQFTGVAGALLAVECLAFVWLYMNYHEMTLVLVSVVLGLIMAFVAYGRMVVKPIVRPLDPPN